MKSKISVVCLLLVLVMLNTASVSAAENQNVRYVKADLEQMCPEELALRERLGMSADTPQVASSRVITTGVGLLIDSSGDAACSATVNGGSDAKTIQIFLYLQKNSTKKNIVSWMDSGDGRVFGMTRHHQLTARGTYIVKMSAYVAKEDGTYQNLVRYSHTDTY